ncbi:hypothetical protein [Mycobacteroides immunogenum]|uniref:Uncharacterized protein n=1 Tax=Mycobacteroides immunogenum TaxID=83262 RepID=A0A7V8LR99_9MYCO|nr:hypothetical protein [Mycobacteroides immunogenum]AMT70485.1 hypothetical protein ABG82_09240 [Mycobacteroides immunogenum]ANO03556.1 hypothetical protein BAB75_09300 [Mycobacteroides immunogenum]KIU41982.1 hypothetical protein TL11_02345 [Mycobacteroides immunogenum]KPG13573.1 hypothetical protein AN909_04570 [Mycobacteroides immunogenum]KPG14506.1 hypothetical protein AN908_08295 [Mycobacteroides immunogenum]
MTAFDGPHLTGAMLSAALLDSLLQGDDALLKRRDRGCGPTGYGVKNGDSFVSVLRDVAGDPVAERAGGFESIRDVVVEKIKFFGHNNLLTLHGLSTRYVAGAILAASRWLQRKAWVRRAVLTARPSGTIKEAEA